MTPAQQRYQDVITVMCLYTQETDRDKVEGEITAAVERSKADGVDEATIKQLSVMILEAR